MCLSSFIMLFLASSCNHLFYHPDHRVYTTPDQLGIKYDAYSVSSPSGALISSWHLHSQATPIYGTVLHFHGNAQNMSSHVLFVSWLTEYGFDVVTFDYSGYGFSTGTASREATVQDSTRILEWLRASPWRTRRPIFVVGQSLGGALAVSALASSGSEQVAALVLDSTFSSYRSLAREKLASFWLSWPLSHPLSFLVSDESSPIAVASDISVPTLMFHAERDPIVPFVEGRRLFEAIAASEKQLISLDASRHTAALLPEHREQRRRMLSFMCSQIKPSGDCGKKKQN